MIDAEAMSQINASAVLAAAMSVSRELGEIKAKVETVPDLARKIDSLEEAVVRREDFIAVEQRVGNLWDAYQRLRGAAWLLGIIDAALTLYVAAHVARVLP